MKNTFLFITTFLGLLSFPQFAFCQGMGMISSNAAVSATGLVGFKDGELHFTGHTSTEADFDAALLHPKSIEPTLVTSGDGEQCMSDGQCYGASINNEIFELRDHYPFAAALVEQPSSMDGKAPAKTIVSIILDGKSYLGHDGSTFEEVVQLELAFADLVSSDPKLSSVSLLHNSTVYSLLKGDSSNVTISDFTLNPDGKTFSISLNFNCIMRSWAYAYTGTGDIILKGKMSKIQIKMPRYISASK